MKYLGIDYGSKRVGLAISDGSLSLAFPRSVVETKNALKEIVALINLENISTVVIGESKDFKMKDNLIMVEVNKFAEELKKLTNIEIVFEPELLSSHQAAKMSGTTENIDASAAAIILQSYLDRRKA